MKQKMLIVLVVVLALILGASYATAAPSLNYTSCFQVQNLDASNAATIVVQYYEQGNSTPTSVNDTIPANSSVTYCPLSDVSSGFNGSVVISSDREVAAIANVSGSNGGDPSGFTTYNASYAGFSSGALEVNLPLLFDDNYGFDTRFNVQNTGTGNATVNVAYSDGSSAGPVTIGPGQAHTFDQAAETHSQAVFAGTVTSDEPIVATVLEIGPTGTPMLFGYNGFVEGSTEPVMPLVQANNYGFTTGIQIQNTGASNSTVEVSYTSTGTGTSCTETKSVAAGSSATFALDAWSSSDPNPGQNTCVNGQQFVGSAQVTSNSGSVELVAIVNQHNFGTNKGASYSSFNASSATDTVVMPLIFDSHYGYFTGFNVMNVGTSSTTVTCTFSGDSRTVVETLDPGVALNDVQLGVLADPDPGGPAGYVGSGVCTASGGGQIIGVVNELLNVGSQDTLLTYEAASN